MLPSLPQVSNRSCAMFLTFDCSDSSICFEKCQTTYGLCREERLSLTICQGDASVSQLEGLLAPALLHYSGEKISVRAASAAQSEHRSFLLFTLHPQLNLAACPQSLWACIEIASMNDPEVGIGSLFMQRTSTSPRLPVAPQGASVRDCRKGDRRERTYVLLSALAQNPRHRRAKNLQPDSSVLPFSVIVAIMVVVPRQPEGIGRSSDGVARLHSIIIGYSQVPA